MKIIDTLNDEQIELLLKGEVVGFFEELIQNGDSFEQYKFDLCNAYYLYNSAEKTISPFYERVINLYNKNTSLPNKTNECIAKVIRSKFIDKWERVYEFLVNEQYSVLDNTNIKDLKTGNNSETINYNSSVEDNGNTGTNVTTTTSNENSNDLYGFNSSEAVGSDLSYGNDTETVVGDSASNTSHNTRDKRGNDNTTFNINESNIKSGRNMSGAELIGYELDLRNKQTFFDIIFKDIDSIVALQIYI